MSSFAVSAERISELFNKKNESYDAFSSFVGVDKSTISRIINGKVKKPSKETIIKIAEFFGVPIEYILDDNSLDSHPDDNDYIKFPNIRDALRFLMKENNIFESSELSDLSGISCTTISKILNGAIDSVGDEVLKKLSEFFGISTAEFLGKKEVNLYKIKQTGQSLKSYTVPVINFDMIENWLITKSSVYICRFDKTFNPNLKSNTFGIDINHNKYEYEFRKGSLLIFEINSNINYNKILFGLYNKKICLFEIIKNEDNIYYRIVGTRKIIACDLDRIKVFGKLVEVKII